ncbi:SNF2 family N-terminal domain-containing protein [Hysterangium stoloniferum]|nr:SNF2 family N-terminal domain-containing protein [Hysterangium stoloniferum]
MPFLPHGSAALNKRKNDGDDLNSHASKQVKGDHSGQTSARSNFSSQTSYWNAQWRAPQTKKHKTWDGDVVIAVTRSPGASYCIVFDQDGNISNRQIIPLPCIKEGDFFKMGEKEFEVDYAISERDFNSGACFGKCPSAKETSLQKPKPPALAKPFAPVKPKINTDVSSSSKQMPVKPVDLLNTSHGQSHTKEREAEKSDVALQWTINWRKPTGPGSSAKQRPYEQDGYLTFSGTSVTLLSDTGKTFVSKSFRSLCICEIRLDKPVAAAAIPTMGTAPNPLQENVESRPMQVPLAKFTAPASFYAKPPKIQNNKPRHDPEADGAVVMKVPTKVHEAKYNKKSNPVIPVVVDPLLSRFLRPHQSDGVKFLYECVMGMRKHEGQGCILADEMGMGKTLQTIALVWTLLKQSPYGGNPVIGKCLIACPVSLVNNWKKEFHKWIGKDRIGVFVGDKDKTVIKQFVNSKIHQVLIIGYERLRGVIADLAYCNPPIGLIICDEGHRLKSAQSKVNQMFDVLRTPRRIILSGTPIQNNLEELHAMTDFVNPGLLDDYTTFKRLYESPLLKSRTPGCSSKDLELGNARSAQLHAICKSFVLRRDASILSNYLPPKFEYVVFIKPSDLQLSIFEKILGEASLSSLICGSTARSLALINRLTKISNSPILLKRQNNRDDESNSVGGSDSIQEAMRLMPDNAKPEDVSLSGKLTALANMLKYIRKKTEEKCIVVSHYTSTLDIIQCLCEKKKYTYNRLDGRTPPNKRQEFVDGFNKSSQANGFLFLLSAKAGGVGLNLIGASRLILIDSDWNPRDGQKRPVFIYRLLTTGTIDEKIYQRQVTKTGLSDSLMSNHLNEETKPKSDSFSPQELRDLFTIHTSTPCHTHDLLSCQCSKTRNTILSGDLTELGGHDHNHDSDSDAEMGWVVASQMKPAKLSNLYYKRKKAELASLDEWIHVNCLLPSAREKMHDDVLRQLIAAPLPDVAETDPKMESITPKSRVEMLLAAVDSASIFDDDEVNNLALGRDMNEVAGGQVTYIFEKKSEATM